MEKGKPHKPSTLGPAFHRWLDWLEFIEGGGKGKFPSVSAPDDLLSITLQTKNAYHVASVLATEAKLVRSAFKFRVDAPSLIAHTGRNEENALHLPYDRTAIVFDNYDVYAHEVSGSHATTLKEKVSLVVLALEVVVPPGGYYQELAKNESIPFAAGDMFINMSFVLHFHTSDTLLWLPWELHINPDNWQNSNMAFPAKFVTFHDPETMGKAASLNTAVKESLKAFLHVLNDEDMQRVRKPGMPAGKEVPMLRNKRKHVHRMYEHWVVKLDLQGDTYTPHTSNRGGEPANRKRLHSVRGHYRTYREKGLRVWIKAHWRGDKNLGVIRKDYDVQLP